MASLVSRTLLVSALLSGLAASGTTDSFNRYIVHARDDAGVDHCHQELAAMGGRIRKPLKLINAIVCDLPAERARLLQTMESAAVIEPDARVYTQCFRRWRQSAQEPSWGHDRIRASELWHVTRGQGSKIGIIDTGIDSNHPDLRGALAGAINTMDGVSSFKDDNGHGTLVAGVIAARDNNIGVVGVAPEGMLYVARALDETGSGNLSDVIEAIEWCLDQGVDVINLSLGTSTQTASLQRAVDAASRAGVLMVAAAGNAGPEDNTVVYPAAYDTVIAVGAVDQENLVPGFSSRGPEVDLVAPGVAIRSTWPRRRYREADGTSLATPFASGTVALYASLFPAYRAEALGALLERSTVELTGVAPNAQGNGLLDAPLGVL